MSKIIYACSRNKPFDSSDEMRISKICKALEPDNLLSPVHHRISVNDKIAFGVMNYHSSIEKNGSLLLGYLYNHSSGWDEPLAEFPDGSYALFRDSHDYLEVVSDPSASRTIWYYFDDNLFVSSTSQRAAVMFLGSFVFDERIIPWMLSTGSLGPELSWDKRLQRLGPDSSVILDKKNWSIAIKLTHIEFDQKHRSDAEHRRVLKDAISKTVNSLKGINYNEWVLPLSGGYDSRGILCCMNDNGKNPQTLKTITWGLKTAINEKGNDAKVAQELARALGANHRYYHTNISEEAIEKVIDRFICCGEGRIDHLSGYMDGLEIWRQLHKEGVKGIIRGDEGFGWNPVSSRLTVLHSVGCMLCSHFSNLQSIIRDFGFSAQELPDSLEIREGESLEQWRDRLYHIFRLPTILAALSDIKFSFVEQITPLLSRNILDRVREMPDHLRTGKSLFKAIVDEISPNIPYATKGAIRDPKDILRESEVVDLLKCKINSQLSNNLFGSDFVRYILNCIKEKGSESNSHRELILRKIKRLLPLFVKNWLNATVYQPRVDGNILAFRVFIIIRMYEILNDDCARNGS